MGVTRVDGETERRRGGGGLQAALEMGHRGIWKLRYDIGGYCCSATESLNGGEGGGTVCVWR